MVQDASAPLMVSGLIGPGGLKRSLVRELLQPHIATQVLQIPLSVRRPHDALMWPHGNTGLYTVKSGYNWLMEKNAISLPSTSAGLQLNWKGIWETGAAPKCKSFVWRACQKVLPVNVNLQNRGVDVDPLCPLCQMEPETVTHALLRCPTVRAIWFSCPLGIRIPEAEVQFHDWISTWLQVQDVAEDVVAVIFTIAWAIWNRRNKMVFTKALLPIPVVIQEAYANVPSPVEFEPGVHGDDATVLLGISSPLSNGNDTDVRWVAPPRGRVKINIDVSVRGTHGTGFGMVAHDHPGKVLAAATETLQEEFSPLMAEALCCRWALWLAQDLGFGSVIMETHCLVLYKAWIAKLQSPSYLSTVVQDCLHISTSFLI